MASPVDVPWPLSSFPGARPQESAGRLINAYAEPLGDGGPGAAIRRRAPGISQFADSGQSGFRGGILVGNLAYLAYENRLITVDSSKTVVNVGELLGTKRVTFAQNKVAPVPDIQCVDPDNGAFAITSSSITPFSGGGNLPQPNSVCAVDAYFFWGIGNNQVFAAGPNSTDVNALTFITAQSKSTGSLVRVINHKGLLWVFTTAFTEIYNNTANAFPTFPFSRFKVLDRGLLGPSAIAGWEDGFSNIIWAADDFSVVRLNGLEPQKISPPDLDRLIRIAASNDPNSLEASCYVDAGRMVWALSAPGWTWEFNLNTEKWNERDSYIPSNVNPIYSRWRNAGTIKAFGKWLVGDTQSGNIGYIDPDVHTEFGQPIRERMESGVVQGFPMRTRVARADFDFVAGVGQSAGSTPNIVEPTVLISWSDDGGIQWSTPIPRSLGQQANATKRVWITGCGQSGNVGRRWRCDIYDPVYGGLIKSTQSTSVRAY